MATSQPSIDNFEQAKEACQKGNKYRHHINDIYVDLCDSLVVRLEEADEGRMSFTYPICCLRLLDPVLALMPNASVSLRVFGCC